MDWKHFIHNNLLKETPIPFTDLGRNDIVGSHFLASRYEAHYNVTILMNIVGHSFTLIFILPLRGIHMWGSHVM